VSNAKIWISVVIHLLLFLTLLSEGYPDILVAVMILGLLFNAAGILVSYVASLKVGSGLYIAGCVVFFPIGVIGMLGARQALDDARRKVFFQEMQ